MLQLSEFLPQIWAVIGIACTGYLLLSGLHKIMYFLKNGSLPKSAAELELEKVRAMAEFEAIELERRRVRAEAQEQAAEDKLSALFERVVDRI